MTKGLLHSVAYLASAGLVAGSMGCCLFASKAPKYRTVVIQPAQEFNVPFVLPDGGVVIIIKQPASQTVVLGSNATFSVLAVKAPPFTTNGVSYQWQKNPVQLNGNLYWTNIPGETSPTLSITNAGTNDVGYYRAIAQAGAATSTSEPVPLVLCVFGSLTVIGTPVVSSGTTASCCTNYIGYVLYPDNPNSNGEWGFIPIDHTATAAAADLNRGSTILEGEGNQGDGPPKLPCVLTTWKVPNGSVGPTIPSTGYAITVYFPSSGPPVPTGNYYLTLGNNFRP